MTVAIGVFAFLIMGATLASWVWRVNYLRHHPVRQQPARLKWVMLGVVVAVCGTEFGVLLATSNRPVTVGRVVTVIAITGGILAYVFWRFSSPRQSRADD